MHELTVLNCQLTGRTCCPQQETTCIIIPDTVRSMLRKWLQSVLTVKTIVCGSGDCCSVLDNMENTKSEHDSRGRVDVLRWREDTLRYTACWRIIAASRSRRRGGRRPAVLVALHVAALVGVVQDGSTVQLLGQVMQQEVADTRCNLSKIEDETLNMQDVL